MTYTVAPDHGPVNCLCQSSTHVLKMFKEWTYPAIEHWPFVYFQFCSPVCPKQILHQIPNQRQGWQTPLHHRQPPPTVDHVLRYTSLCQHRPSDKCNHQDWIPTAIRKILLMSCDWDGIYGWENRWRYKWLLAFLFRIFWVNFRCQQFWST